MEINKPVSNPMLVGAIELMKAEDTPEHRNTFVSEVMKAVFLSPVAITPAPVQDESGEFHMQEGSQMQFPILKAADGKQFFMAFTDLMELKKWKDEEGQQTLSMRLENYAQMLFGKDSQGNMNPASGFAINPFGGNIIITREMLAGFMAARQAKQPPKQ